MSLLQRLRPLAAALGLACTTNAASAALPQALDRVLQAYHLPASSVSALVQAVDADTPLIEVNADVARNPASTIKLITTFVALDVLGPTYSWPTEVYALGPIRDGVLTGDLGLKGYGDPYLLEESLWKMLGELRRKGLVRITGDLAIDDSHFAPDSTDPAAFDGQPFRLYNVRPNALIMNFKAVTYRFTPRADGGGVIITTDPELPNLAVVNRLTLVDGPCRGLLASVSMTVPDPVRADRVVFSGDYPRACREQTLPRTALEPATYAYGLFSRLWAQWGGRVDGSVRRATIPAGAQPYLVWHSPPLAELIRPLNKWSNNVMADALLYTLADTAGVPPVDPRQGAEVVRAYLVKHGVPAAGFVMENGSGLSRNTRISARTMHDLLAHAYRSPYMPEYMASLSLAGLDGTMRRRFRRAPETGRMHLKTGHLNDVAAVAGYVLARSGTTYAVALLINDPGVARGGGRALMDATLDWTYQH